MAASNSISIVIPTHNSNITLCETLRSISKQSVFPHELIIVDDASDDPVAVTAPQFAQIIQKLKNNSIEVKIIRIDKKQGPAAARNKGAESAKSDIVLFLDADVILQPEGIKRIVNTYSKQSDITAVQGVYTSEIESQSSVFSKFQNHYYHFAFKTISIQYPSVCATFCFAVKRDVFVEMGGFNTNIKSPTVEDEAFGYDLAENNHRIYLHRGLQVTHLAEYTFSSLVLRKFRMSFYQVKSLLRGIKPPVRGKNGKNETHHSNETMAAIIFAPLVLLAWLWTWPAGILMTLIYTALNARFWSYLVKTEPPVNVIEMIAITWIDQMTIFCGLSVGATDFFMGHKY